MTASLAAGAGRWAWAEIDLAALRHNVAELRRHAQPSQLWAVVKADGYGHGAITVAEAAVEAGASGLCVALAGEAAQLRQAGITAPILVLSEQPPALAPALVAFGVTATVSTGEGVAALGAAARAAGVEVGVHVKVDSGMHRVGVAPDDLGALWAAVAAEPGVVAQGVFSHLAVADEPERPETAEQLARFDAAVDALGLDDTVAVHAANSAGLLAHPHSRRTLVRAGIALYGIAPGPRVADYAPLRPVLSLKARVSFVKRLRAGDSLSYGLRHTLAADANVATVPIGYADGVRRGLSGTATTVLVGGRRCPIVGTITMDQLLVDCGDDDVASGDEVVLIGTQGAETVTVEEWASALGTIGYEIVCGIGPRVPRRVLP